MPSDGCMKLAPWDVLPMLHRTETQNQRVNAKAINAKKSRKKTIMDIWGPDNLSKLILL